ncbi:DNA recombination protein RmuC [Atopobiaceae bacterium 24-176]
MDVLIAVLAAVAAVASVVAAVRAGAPAQADDAHRAAISDLSGQVRSSHAETVQALARMEGASGEASRQMDALRGDVTSQLASTTALLDRRLSAMGESVNVQLASSVRALDERVARTNETVASQLGAIRTDNALQLEQMRSTVDEKLERTLNERLSSSFQQINEQLESVHQGLGSMQALASNVGDLKRVLSNVKTRGILGEVQLGAILAEVLAPEQYVCDVATKPGSRDRVEFAVKVPQEGGEPILLPIDAKFPGDLYERLVAAQEAADRDEVRQAQKDLARRICQEAADVSSKYLSVPDTTNFAIMFLPFEGLYAEVVSQPGLIERLQRDCCVNVAGPSTMAALLNSLQLSYQTFAMQRQTDRIIKVLQAVKAELPVYQKSLETAKRRIDSAGEAVDKIITTRTNVMARKLKDVSLEGAVPGAVELEEARVEQASDSSDAEVGGVEDSGADRDVLGSIFED